MLGVRIRTAFQTAQQRVIPACRRMGKQAAKTTDALVVIAGVPVVAYSVESHVTKSESFYRLSPNFPGQWWGKNSVAPQEIAKHPDYVGLPPGSSVSDYPIIIEIGGYRLVEYPTTLAGMAADDPRRFGGGPLYRIDTRSPNDLIENHSEGIGPREFNPGNACMVGHTRGGIRQGKNVPKSSCVSWAPTPAGTFDVEQTLATHMQHLPTDQQALYRYEVEAGVFGPHNAAYVPLGPCGQLENQREVVAVHHAPLDRIKSVTRITNEGSERIPYPFSVRNDINVNECGKIDPEYRLSPRALILLS